MEICYNKTIEEERETSEKTAESEENEMTKTIHVCDQCKKEVDWVYEMPRLVIEGLKINLYPARMELCENCAKERLAIYNCERWQ